MTETSCRFARWMLAVDVVVILAGRGFAAPVLDVTNDVGGSAAARELRPSNFWAQSFTVTKGGLLSQVDVQLGKFAGATGDVRFELRPLVGGLPTTDDEGMLFMSTIGINDIPEIISLADPPPFVSVDVSSAGIHAKPGEVYAISMRRSGGTPAAAWRSKTNSYAGGTGFFRNLLNVPWGPSAEDLGFQTWIDTTPTAPYKLRVDATYDVTYRPGTVSSLIEGETSLLIGGIPGHATLPEQRPMMEFPIGGLPTNAVIQGAYLDLDWGGSSGEPRIEITGFAGDGIASFADVTAAGTQLAITPPTHATSSSVVPIDSSMIQALRGQASHLGVRMLSLDLPEYVTFYATDHASLLPPRLVIEYTLAQLAGDYDSDGTVNGADYAVWRGQFGNSVTPGQGADGNGNGIVDAADYAIWRKHTVVGTSSSAALVTVPEPSNLALLLVAMGGAIVAGRVRVSQRL